MTRHRRASSPPARRPSVKDAPKTSSWPLSPNPRVGILENHDVPADEGYFSLGRVADQRSTTISIPNYVAAEIELVKRNLVEALRAYDEIEELRGRETDDGLEVWVLTRQIPHERTLEIYRERTPIRQEFPDVSLDLHVLHSGMFEADEVYPEITFGVLQSMVPEDAEHLIDQ